MCPDNLQEVTDDLITVRNNEEPHNEFDINDFDLPFGETLSDEFEVSVDVLRIDVYTLVITTKETVPGDILVTLQTEEMEIVNTTADYVVNAFVHFMSQNCFLSFITALKLLK